MACDLPKRKLVLLFLRRVSNAASFVSLEGESYQLDMAVARPVSLSRRRIACR